MRSFYIVNALKKMGPGFLYAGAAIGVSHLVHSTRAGAEYGFLLAGIILLTNILKYPFFEVGPKSVHRLGKDLIASYKSLGKFHILSFSIISLLTVFITQAAIVLVTASLAESIFGLGLTTAWWSLIVCAICSGILFSGKLKHLDGVVKVLILLLSIATIIGVSMAFSKASFPLPESSFLFEKADILILVALVGWMPAPMDLAVWNSIWTKDRLRTSNGLWEMDFNLGYWGTTLLGVLFLSMGALVMFPTGNTFSASGIEFAKEFVGMYGAVFGKSVEVIVAIAALATMFSTSITCMDAIPRTLMRCQEELMNVSLAKKAYGIWMLVLVGGVLLILTQFIQNMRALVVLASVVSFVTAPLLAYFNLQVMRMEPVNKLEKGWTNRKFWFARISLWFLVAFALMYLYTLLKF